MDWQMYFQAPFLVIYGVIFIILYQLFRLYQLDKIVSTKILLQITNSTGKTEFKPSEKQGNSVSLPKKDGTSDMWVIDKNCMRTTSFPIGSGIPFLKRDIQMVELDADSWEPIKFDRSDKTIVGSPRLLGTLFNEKVAAAIVGLGKEFTDAIKNIKGNNPLYMLFGALALGAGFAFISSSVFTILCATLANITLTNIVMKTTPSTKSGSGNSLAKYNARTTQVIPRGPTRNMNLSLAFQFNSNPQAAGALESTIKIAKIIPAIPALSRTPRFNMDPKIT